MALPLSAARCFHHATREAIGRCKGCSRHYCRECLADVQGKLTCATCMRSETEHQPQRFAFRRVLAGVSFFIGVMALWLLFYSLGQLLLEVPEAFHTGYFE